MLKFCFDSYLKMKIIFAKLACEDRVKLKIDKIVIIMFRYDIDKYVIVNVKHHVIKIEMTWVSVILNR